MSIQTLLSEKEQELADFSSMIQEQEEAGEIIEHDMQAHKTYIENVIIDIKRHM